MYQTTQGGKAFLEKVRPFTRTNDHRCPSASIRRRSGCAGGFEGTVKESGIDRRQMRGTIVAIG
jgi:hypothetical protein